VAWTEDEKRRNLYGVKAAFEYKPIGRIYQEARGKPKKR